jgi:hypothetical protein
MMRMMVMEITQKSDDFRGRSGCMVYLALLEILAKIDGAMGVQMPDHICTRLDLAIARRSFIENFRVPPP